MKKKKRSIAIWRQDHSEEPVSIFKRRRNFQINDKFLVSREESERRLQIGCIALSFPLIIVGTVLTILYCQSFQSHSPTVFRPNKTTKINPFRGFPIPHIALVYPNGSFYDLSLHENISTSQKFFLKLPKDQKYFGYSDPLGVLHLISSTISRKITRYHTTFGHQVIPKSVPKNHHAMDRFHNGLQVGDKFWVWGVEYKENHLHERDQFRPKTYVWYINRQLWKKGPKLKHKFRRPSASTAINATHALIVTGVAREHDLQSFAYDFELEIWTTYPKVETSILYSAGLIEECAMTILVSKQARK